MSYSDALQKVFDQIEKEIDAGLKHGHFRLEVQGELIQGNKRRVIVDAGKKHRFVVSPEDIGV